MLKNIAAHNRPSVEGRRMGPLRADHWLVREAGRCPACERIFSPGDFVTLFGIGPGADVQAREAARLGRPYNAIALAVHYACATGIE